MDSREAFSRIFELGAAIAAELEVDGIQVKVLIKRWVSDSFYVQLIWYPEENEYRSRAVNVKYEDLIHEGLRESWKRELTREVRASFGNPYIVPPREQRTGQIESDRYVSELVEESRRGNET